MARYLIQIDPARGEQVKSSLGGIGVRPIAQMFDYISVDIPPELVSKVQAIPGVVGVRPDTKVGISQLLLPVDKKLAEFQRLFFSNPITGPLSAFKFSLEADTGKKRVPTSESGKMVGADVAEREGISGKGIKVAVLDTGTSFDFLFQGPYNEGSKSSIEGQPIPLDEVGHSTHVMTTISGRPFQSIRGLLKGVAIDSEVAAFKCLGGGIGIGMTSWILRAMADAVEWKADIISMSLGGDDEDYTTSPYHRIISALTKQGMIFVIACLAGNTRILLAKPKKYESAKKKVSYFKQISRIKPGDRVIAYDVDTGKLKEDVVIAVSKRRTREIFEVEIEGGTILRGTGEHPILTDKGWVPLSILKVGDNIYTTEVPSEMHNPYKKGRETRTCPVCLAEFVGYLSIPQKCCSWACEIKLRKLTPGWGVAGAIAARQSLAQRPEVRLTLPLLEKTAVGARKNSEHIEKLKKLGTEALLRYKREHPEESRKSSQRGAISTRKLIRIPKAQRVLLEQLLALGVPVKSEYPIYSQEGQLITIGDIVLPDHKLAIFVDGQYWHGTSETQSKDKLISAQLIKLGWVVLRYSDVEIQDKLSECVRNVELNLMVTVDPKVIAVRKARGSSYVFDLKLERYHTFIANGVVVHNCGNSGPDPNTIGSPGSCPDALTVGAVSYPDGKIAEFSSRGPTLNGLMKPDVCAPGVDILSTSSGYIAAMQVLDGPPSLAAISGTSMATPHVSGLVALALQYARMKGKNITTDHIKEAMSLYGEYAGAKNNDYGFGLITWSILKKYIDGMP